MGRHDLIRILDGGTSEITIRKAIQFLQNGISVPKLNPVTSGCGSYQAIRGIRMFPLPNETQIFLAKRQ